jgi:hypothetical protein
MAKFGGGSLDHAGFNAIKERLTAVVAVAIEKTLVEMGEDVKGISWFSSVAHDYATARQKLAA